MKFGSVCSGIEAASVAWESLGFEAQWFSEIEHFPSEVLKYRYPTVPNLGDMTKLTQNETFKTSSINLLVGGTPCQSFSVAGLRGGLADPRGNLMLTFLALADAKKPRWIVWENVPGVLSSNGGKDFGTFLGALGELGYGFAYRVLDAQHFGVAQRRRRVFVVGYLGDWRPAAAVLFERESLSRDSKPSRKKGKETTTDAEGGVGTTGNPKISNALCARDYKGPRPEADQGAPVIIEQVAQPIAFQPGNLARKGGADPSTKTFPTLTKNSGDQSPHVAQPQYFESHPNDSRVTGPHDVGNTVSARYGTGGGNTPLVSQPIAVDVYNQTIDGQTSATLTKAVGGTNTSGPKIAQPISLDCYNQSITGDKVGIIREQHGTNMNAIAVDVYNQSINEKTSQTVLSQKNPTNIGAVLEPTIIDRAAFNQGPCVAVDAYNQTINEKTTQTISSSASDINHIGGVLQTMAIRRLTPKECERLQGFPDDWTKIPYRNKPADQCPDGPRYKACGNSMAVPVMRWIGQRIQLIDTILNK